jgi:glycosyltransferase involved in cell wall biosynthesis
VVAATILDYMPASRYRVLLVTAAGSDALRARVASDESVIHLAKSYTYLNQNALRERLAWLPTILNRPRNWLDASVRFTRNSGYTASLIRIIRRKRIALIHLNNGFENLEAHLAAAVSRRPLVVHAHGGTAKSRLTRRLARQGHPAIAIAEGVATSLREAGVAADRVRVIPNPLTVEPRPLTAQERYTARARYGIPESAVTAAIVGRVVRWKGQAEFLRAFAAGARDAPGAMALIVGDVTDGNEGYREELGRLVTELGIADRVRFIGFVADPRLAYGLADVVVHASVEPEPFGLVLTEAMALGIPVVAANAGGPLDIITNGVDGFLRAPGATDQLAAIVRILLSQGDLRQRIGAAGRESVTRRFDPGLYVERIASVYDSLLEDKARHT